MSPTRCSHSGLMRRADLEHRRRQVGQRELHRALEVRRHVAAARAELEQRLQRPDDVFAQQVEGEGGLVRVLRGWRQEGNQGARSPYRSPLGRPVHPRAGRRVARLRPDRDRHPGPAPVAVRPGVEDRIGQAGDPHREAVEAGGDAAAARRHDRAVVAARAERAETRGQLGRREQPTVGTEVAVGRRVPGGRDVAGDRVDRLGLAAVARSGAGIEEHDLAEPPGELVRGRSRSSRRRGGRAGRAGAVGRDRS